MTLSLRIFCSIFLVLNWMTSTSAFAEGRTDTVRETPKVREDRIRAEKAAAAAKAAETATDELNKASRAEGAKALEEAGRTGTPRLGGAAGGAAAPRLGEGAVKDPVKKTGGAEDHRTGTPAIQGKTGARSSRFAADDVLKDTAFTKRMADKLTRDGEGKVTGIDPKVKARGEAVEAMKLADNYGKLRSAFNENTMKDHAKKLKEIRASLASSKLTPAEKATLETAILIFLKEVEKDPKAAADAMKQLDDLMKDFADEMADSDPKMREMAMKYILGTLAFYGKSVDGKVQLSVAKELWNTTQGTAREGLADMMEARAKLHSEFIAKEIASGKGANQIDYAAAWKHVEDGTIDWALARLAANGEDLSKLPDTVRDILCKCSKHAAACKV